MKKQFKYFSINDSKQEAIGKVIALDIEQAWNSLSLIKNLPIKDLRKLYVIVELI
jgi:hypothetical protein